MQLTLEQIDLIRRLVLLYPQHMSLVTTADGIEESHKKGKLASLIGIEGGHSIGTSLAVLRMFYALGARYLTLTHTCNTPWAGECSFANQSAINPRPFSSFYNFYDPQRLKVQIHRKRALKTLIALRKSIFE